MIPSNFYSHNPDDLRDNYDNGNYSTPNYQPNANNSFQNDPSQAPQSFMLQQHHFNNNNNRAPSYTNFSDTGVSIKSQPQQQTPSYNNNNINLDNTYNFNNNNNNMVDDLENFNNNFNNLTNNNMVDHDNNLPTNEGTFRSPTVSSSIHPSTYLPSSTYLPPQDRSQSRASNNNYLLKENRITPSPFPLADGGVLNNSYRPQPTNPNSRAQSSSQFPLDSSQEKPDLSDVIDLLSHHSDSVKANAAAYLQHLSYMDDNVKVQTRALRGLPPLLDLLSHPDPQVHRSACGALRNLSYGRANDENKREIRKLGGVAGLARLLKRSGHDDVQELVTGIIWNLSSCPDIKTTIIDESLKTLMDVVVIPLSGWSRTAPPVPQEAPNYRSTTFRNATGVLRNVSSEGEYARRKMRECHGLVQSLYQVLLTSIQRQDCDNKSIENCVCVLRNLSFALQEVADPDYLRKRMATPLDADDKAGCFGNKSKLVHKVKHEGHKNPPTSAQLRANPAMTLLWSPRLLDAYLPLLKECSNPDTLEATAGTIQNVTACDWQPSVDFRAAVRKLAGLPIIADLLNYSSDKVICSSATALRNLAVDEKNKEQIGKNSMRELVSKLPTANADPSDYPLSAHTLAALLSTLYEVIKNSLPYTRSLVGEGGVGRLVSISKSQPSAYSEKAVRYANHLLYRIWKHNEFQEGIRKQGWSVEDLAKLKNGGRLSAENTINRPIMSQSPHDNHSYKHNNSNQATLEYKQATGGDQRDEEIALDVLQNMQLSDRYPTNLANNNYNNTNNNNNNKSYNSTNINNYSNNKTLNNTQKYNSNSRNTNNFNNDDNFKNQNNNYNNDLNMNNNNNFNNNNTNSRANSNINLNNNSELFNQNYVDNSPSYSNNSQANINNSNNNINNNFQPTQNDHRLSNNTNTSNNNYHNTANNNYHNNLMSHNTSNNNYNNNPNSNNNLNINTYPNNPNNNNQQNNRDFSNTMQGFIEEDYQPNIGPQQRAY